MWLRRRLIEPSMWLPTVNCFSGLAARSGYYSNRNVNVLSFPVASVPRTCSSRRFRLGCFRQAVRGTGTSLSYGFGFVIPRLTATPIRLRLGGSRGERRLAIFTATASHFKTRQLSRT
jgi:hypothetical protein